MFLVLLEIFLDSVSLHLVLQCTSVLLSCLIPLKFDLICYFSDSFEIPYWIEKRGNLRWQNSMHLRNTTELGWKYKRGAKGITKLIPIDTLFSFSFGSLLFSRRRRLWRGFCKFMIRKESCIRIISLVISLVISVCNFWFCCVRFSMTPIRWWWCWWLDLMRLRSSFSVRVSCLSMKYEWGNLRNAFLDLEHVAWKQYEDKC